MDAELQRLKAAWQRQELHLEGIEALALLAWREPRRQQVQRRLRRFGIGQLLWLLAWIGVVAFAAGFWVEHRQTPHLLAAGLALHAYGIAAIWVSATRALLAARLHATGPVLEQLRQLARLRRFTTVSEVALGLPWWCLWLVAAQVAVYRWLGVDLYAAAPRWFGLTLAFGAAAMVASLWLARRWARRPPATPWLRRTIDDLSGCNLARAQAQLREIERFERD